MGKIQTFFLFSSAQIMYRWCMTNTPNCHKTGVSSNVSSLGFVTHPTYYYLQITNK